MSIGLKNGNTFFILFLLYSYYVLRLSFSDVEILKQKFKRKGHFKNIQTELDYRQGLGSGLVPASDLDHNISKMIKRKKKVIDEI